MELDLTQFCRSQNLGLPETEPPKKMAVPQHGCRVESGVNGVLVVGCVLAVGSVLYSYFISCNIIWIHHIRIPNPGTPQDITTGTYIFRYRYIMNIPVGNWLYDCIPRLLFSLMNSGDMSGQVAPAREPLGAVGAGEGFHLLVHRGLVSPKTVLVIQHLAALRALGTWALLK